MAHPQLFVELLHLPVGRGRKQGSGGIAYHGAVVFRHPAELFEPVEIRVLFPDAIHQKLVIIMVFQIFAPAGHGNACLIHIDGGFRGHHNQGEDGQQLQVEVLLFIIISKNSIQT